MVALHDANKYRGTLKVYKFSREQFTAMFHAANRAVSADEVRRAVELYISQFGPTHPVEYLEEQAFKSASKQNMLMLIFNELRMKGHFEMDGNMPKEPVASWRSYDESSTGPDDWVAVTYTQGEDAIPARGQ